MLELDKLSIRIGNKQVVQDFSLHIGAGERWAVLGINGVGKTTLLHTLCGLRPPTSGKVSLGGTALSALPPRQRAQQIALMSQDDDFATETRVIDAVMLGRLPYLHWWRGETTEDQRIAHAALAQVGLDDSFAQRLAWTLSGGERRRVALATLLAQAADLLVLDEPTTHLDLHQQIALLDLLAGLDGHTQIMSLHDVNLATRYCTHALLLFGDGQCCGGPIAAMIQPAVLTRLYRHDIRSVDSESGPLYFPA